MPTVLWVVPREFYGKAGLERHESSPGSQVIAMVGAIVAIVNAVHHATGKRIRHLPMRIEDLLQ